MADYDTIDQWVDWGGHTVVVDHMKETGQWIHAGEDGRHLDAMERGRADTALKTRHIMALLAGQKAECPPETFLPTANFLESLPLFPSHCRQTPRGCGEHATMRSLRDVGKLPVIAAKIRAGFDEVANGDIERDVYLSEHRIAANVFTRA